MKKPKYRSLTTLLNHRLGFTEDDDTAELIKKLKPALKRRFLLKPELEAICHWKSARAIRHIQQNSPAIIRSKTKAAFASRSEQKRLELLCSLHGVSIPMASAILTLVWPERYGVIDIRVWQLLYAMKSVTTKPSGVGFNFKNWFRMLCIFRHHAKRLGCSVRDVERTIFRYHQFLQTGQLYKSTK